MAARKGKKKAANNEQDPIGFEAKLWYAADKLRGHLAEEKHAHIITKSLLARQHPAEGLSER